MHENVSVARERMSVYVCMASHQKPNYVSVARQRYAQNSVLGTIRVNPNKADFSDCSRTHMDGASPLADFFL